MDDVPHIHAPLSKSRKLETRSSVKSRLNKAYGFDRAIVELIAQHIAPNPIIYLRLACVSKLFHQVFTSDQIWRFLDVHGHGSPIAARFSGRARELELGQLSQLIDAWTSPRGWADPENSEFWLTYTTPLGSRAAYHTKFLTSESIRPSPNPDILLAFLARCHPVKDPEASTRISANFHVAFCALNLNANALYHLHPKWRLDLDLVRAAANRGHFQIQIVPKNLWKDPLVLKGLSRHDINLGPLCKQLSVDLQLALLGYNGETLQFLSDSLRNDTEVVLASLECTPRPYAYASKRLQADKQVILKALSFNCEFFEENYYPKGLEFSIHEQHEPRCKSWLSHIPPESFQDQDIINVFLTANGGLLPCEYYENNYIELGKCAIRHDVRNFWRVPPSVVSRETLVQALSMKFPFDGKRKFPRYFLDDLDPDTIRRVFASPSFYIDINELELYDESVCVAAIESCAGAYFHVRSELRSTPRFIETVIRANPACRGLANGFDAINSTEDVQALCQALGLGEITLEDLTLGNVLGKFQGLLHRDFTISQSAVHGCSSFWPLLTIHQASDLSHQLCLLSGRKDMTGVQQYLKNILALQTSQKNVLLLTETFTLLYFYLPPHMQAHPKFLSAIAAQPLLT